MEVQLIAFLPSELDGAEYVSFTNRRLYLQGKSLRYPVNKRRELRVEKDIVVPVFRTSVRVEVQLIAFLPSGLDGAEYVSFTNRRLYLQGKSLRYPVNKRRELRVEKDIVVPVFRTYVRVEVQLIVFLPSELDGAEYVSFTNRRLYHQGKSLRYPVNKILNEP